MNKLLLKIITIMVIMAKIYPSNFDVRYMAQKAQS